MVHQTGPASAPFESAGPTARAKLVVNVAWISKFYIDRQGNASRPKLLFTVAAADALAASGVWPLANAILSNPIKGSWLEGLAVLTTTLLVSALLHSQWSYTIPSLRRLMAQIVKIVISVAAVGLSVAGFAFLIAPNFVAPTTVCLWMVLTVMMLSVTRLITSVAVEALTRAGRLVRRTVIVGGGKDADELVAAFAADSSTHMKVLGLFDDRQGDRVAECKSGLARLGTFEKLAAFCRDSAVDLLIVTVPPRAEERLMQILEKLFTLQVDVRVSALNSKLRLNSRAYSYVGRVPMLAVMDKPLSDWDRVLKNIEDRVIGALLLILVSPVMAIVAIAIRWDSKGPIFFKQKRYGFNNEVIEVYKFRSMYVDKADLEATKLVTRDDPRVTRVGRFIRRASIDELPQFINVLRGEMSLVGPRPHATGAKADRDLYETVAHGYFARHRVKPGVTGWAQINGWRGETDTHEKLIRRVEHDLYYIDNWSVLFDLYIIAMTPVSLVTTKNAY